MAFGYRVFCYPRNFDKLARLTLVDKMVLRVWAEARAA